MSSIEDKIYKLRKRRGLSQEELAEAVGVSRQTISKWEMGRAVPDTTNIIELSRFFEVELGYFILNEDECIAEACGGCDMEVANLEAAECDPDEKPSVGRRRGPIVIVLVCLGILACAFIFITICLGIMAFSTSARDGSIEKIYFSNLDLSFADLFLIFIVISVLLVIGIAIICISIALRNKKKKQNGG